MGSFFSCADAAVASQLRHCHCGQGGGGCYIAEKRPASLILFAGTGTHWISPLILLCVFDPAIPHRIYLLTIAVEIHVYFFTFHAELRAHGQIAGHYGT
jgi:hypothetical protein